MPAEGHADLLEPSGRGGRRELVPATVLGCLGFGSFLVYALALGTRGTGLLLSLVVFLLVFLPLPALGVTRCRHRLRSWVHRSPVVRTGGLLVLPALLYSIQGAATGTLDPGFLWRYLAYAGAPTALVLHVVRSGEDPLRATVRTASAILLLWVPLDFGWLTAFRVPAGVPGGLNLMRLLVLGIALLLFTVVAPVRDLGFTFRVTMGDLGRALLALAVLAIVLVPVGLAIGFLDVGLVPFAPFRWAILAVTLYFATTLHEEFIFRGVIQNLAEKRWRGGRPLLAGLIIGAVVFGLAHLNNPPAPNYHYVLMAALAGSAYGWVWLATRKVTVSALTHLGVNWLWMLTLRGGAPLPGG